MAGEPTYRNRRPLTRSISQQPLPEPQPAHTRRSDADSDSDNEREATELRSVRSLQQSGRRQNSRILSSPPAVASTIPLYDPVRRFWRHCVRISVPHDDCRDHLANERTFLGYLRTSLALAMIGVVVAQLYRLQHSPNPDPKFGYFVLSKPIACIFHVSAACVALLGSARFFRQQNAMAAGKVQAGGGELMIIGSFVLLLLVAIFAIHVGMIVYQS